VSLGVSGGELTRTLIVMIALAAHLLLCEPLCLRGLPLVRRQTPLANQRTYSSESARHGHLSDGTMAG